MLVAVSYNSQVSPKKVIHQVLMLITLKLFGETFGATEHCTQGHHHMCWSNVKESTGTLGFSYLWVVG